MFEYIYNIVETTEKFQNASRKIRSNNILRQYIGYHSLEIDCFEQSMRLHFAQRIIFVLYGKISLRMWCELSGVNYSTAQKWVKDNTIPSTYRFGQVLVDYSQELPIFETIECLICGERLGQITGTHLQKCSGITLETYQENYSTNIVTDQTVRKIIEFNSGRVFTQEHKDNISSARTGIIPKNHPRFVKGSYTASKETRQKMSDSYRSQPSTKFKDTRGELFIKNWLGLKQISYETQKRLPGSNHPYDFVLFERQIVIEFDGGHHWHKVWFKVKKDTTPEEARMFLEEQRLKDELHTRFAENLGYLVIRIKGLSTVGDSEHGTMEEQLDRMGVTLQ